MKSKSIKIYLTGGLGNQLFQLFNVMSAKSSGDITLEGRLGNPRGGFQGQPDLALFNLPDGVGFNGSGRSSLLVNKVISYLLRRHLLLNSNLLYRINNKFLISIAFFVVSFYYRQFTFLIIGKGIGYSQMRLKNRNYLVVGYFQSYHVLSDKNKLKQLTLIKDSEFTRQLENYMKLSLEERPIMVHIRLGDYKNEPDFGIPSSLYYEKALNYLTEKFKESKIWIFSDENELAKDIFPSKYNDRARWVDSSLLSSAEIIEVMKLGHSFVIANSTLSWWGATMSGVSGSNIVSPLGWFRNIKEPLDLIPPDWIRIQAW